MTRDALTSSPGSGTGVIWTRPGACRCAFFVSLRPPRSPATRTAMVYKHSSVVEAYAILGLDQVRLLLLTNTHRLTRDL